MMNRTYLRKSSHPHPHIGQLVKKVMRDKKLSQAEVARRMTISPSSLANYFKQPSLQFGILWNLGIAMEYDFLTEITDYYPQDLHLNPESKIIKELDEKNKLIADLQKEIGIYKRALGIKE
ncbi:helix-turn-helix transcriptional regulator [Chryseobacterium sp. POE27]|uniref:helix-turn-helix transcriptional regulator n=1 Tax=Chryseobacterium sp. POE27 TaxID=3138177 RepID=UPI00321BA492